MRRDSKLIPLQVVAREKSLVSRLHHQTKRGIHSFIFSRVVVRNSRFLSRMRISIVKVQDYTFLGLALLLLSLGLGVRVRCRVRVSYIRVSFRVWVGLEIGLRVGLGVGLDTYKIIFVLNATASVAQGYQVRLLIQRSPVRALLGANDFFFNN